VECGNKEPLYRLGAYHRLADHLHRYSATREYYVVSKLHGKTKWFFRDTTGQKFASRNLRKKIESKKRPWTVSADMICRRRTNSKVVSKRRGRLKNPAKIVELIHQLAGKV
jgi:hypothetical protein